MMPVLNAKNIVKYFHQPEEFKVLKNIDLEINKGEFVSIVGKSGCGKSTLLYILSTMDTDYEGELEIAGMTLKNRSQLELSQFRNEHIGFVFQFHFLLPEFSALENVMLPALRSGRWSRDEVEHRALEKLSLLGMKEYATKLSSRLSGGQQQRVAIARSLINNPTLIIGDEPTGNLDSVNTNIAFDIFKDLAHNHGQTIIAVTHDNDFAANTDRIIEMSDGRIVSGNENSKF